MKDLSVYAANVENSSKTIPLGENSRPRTFPDGKKENERERN